MESSRINAAVGDLALHPLWQRHRAFLHDRQYLLADLSRLTSAALETLFLLSPVLVVASPAKKPRLHCIGNLRTLTLAQRLRAEGEIPVVVCHGIGREAIEMIICAELLLILLVAGQRKPARAVAEAVGQMTQEQAEIFSCLFAGKKTFAEAIGVGRNFLGSARRRSDDDR